MVLCDVVGAQQSLSRRVRNHQRTQSARSSKLPITLRVLFWDYDFATLTWDNDRDLIMARILTAGSWDAVTWLRSRVGDDALGEWIERHRGDGLSPQRLRFWELILGLPHRQVNAWLAAEGRQVWDKRTRPYGGLHTAVPCECDHLGCPSSKMRVRRPRPQDRFN